jgi:biopolymer transport protein ExbD
MADFIRKILMLLIAVTCCMACTTSRVIEDTRVPEVVIDSYGKTWINDKPVAPGKIGRTLKSAGFRREQEVNVLVADPHDRRSMQTVTADLVKNGFTRSIFITNRTATSSVQQKK